MGGVAAAAKGGLARGNITIVADGSATAPQVAALVTGQVDAQVSAVALGWNWEQQRKGRLLAPASDFVGPFLLNAIYTRNDFITEHPDAVRGFPKGRYDTVNFMATHRAERPRSKNRSTVFRKPSTTSTMVDLHMLPTEPDCVTNVAGSQRPSILRCRNIQKIDSFTLLETPDIDPWRIEAFAFLLC